MKPYHFYMALREAAAADLSLAEFRELHGLTNGQLSSYYRRNRQYTYCLPKLRGMRGYRKRQARAARPAIREPKHELGTGVSYVNWA